MIRVQPGDLVAVAANQKYYYALILDRVRLFGGNWTYAFHRTSTDLLKAQDVLGGPQAGFHAFIDFIWAKRENRLIRLARGIGTSGYEGPGYLKGTNQIREKAKLWFIHDMAFREVKRVSTLSAEEKRYPLKERIDDVLMTQRVNEKWLPEQDECI